MDRAIEIARTTGISYVGVRGSTHFGMAAYYPLRALDSDIAIPCDVGDDKEIEGVIEFIKAQK